MTGVIANGVGVGTSPTAWAHPPWGINGTYAAVSDGNQAKTNEQYRNEAVVRSTWTIETSCTSPVDCTGTVVSDAGWTAPIYTRTGIFWVKRTVPGWEKCDDGTAADGLQEFRFYPAAPDGSRTTESTTLAGEDKTTGPSGACGRSLWLVIRMPLRLDQIR
jgi:hypothetical protein